MVDPASEPTLVHVPTVYILLAAAPLLPVAWASYFFNLRLESPILVGCIRTFVQLSILGLILRPIFSLGVDHWWIVVGYVLLMLIVTSYECAGRPKYYFRGMFENILGALVLNVTPLSLFAFGLIIKPQPVPWEPQYVIPIVGMLLGNTTNGVSLSLNSVLTFLVEDKSEIELLLCFGGSSIESCGRLLREAVRTGAMPMLNSMAVIGIISIPGMMTGQILGGSPVMEAAWYQILIMYLIAICAFGTILTVISLALRVGFDFSTATLRSDRLIKRKDRASFLDLVSGFFNSLFTWTTGRASFPSREMEGLYSDVETYSSPKGQLRIETLIPPVELSKSSHVEVLQVKRSFQSDDKDERMVLFHNVSIKVGAGEIMLVGGPSGTGKSQLLRLIAGLSPLEDEGDIFLDGISFRIHYKDVAVWRQRVRYVTQYKIDIPGSPKDFVKNITRFSSWNHKNSASPSKDEMLGSCYELLKKWGMEASYLEKEWSQLSGGEAQRVIVAIALASRPQVLLMDESTSALDLKTKIKVEESIVECASRFKMSVLWVSHDTDQVERMRRVSRNGP